MMEKHLTKFKKVELKVLATQSSLTLCNPMEPARLLCPWILQARILEWVAIPFSGGSSWPRGRSQVSGTAGTFFTVRATREAQIQEKNPTNSCVGLGFQTVLTV